MTGDVTPEDGEAEEDFFANFHRLDDDSGWEFDVTFNRTMTVGRGTAETIDDALTEIRRNHAAELGVNESEVRIEMLAHIGEEHARMLDGLLYMGRELKRSPDVKRPGRHRRQPPS